jgi:uncharacterized CHY-type Zn-finger protein
MSTDEASTQEVLNAFGYAGNLLSIKSSSETHPGLGNTVPDIDAIRALLCTRLYECIFKPFHLSLANNELESMQYSKLLEVCIQMGYCDKLKKFSVANID